jgi:hypothetical protein
MTQGIRLRDTASSRRPSSEGGREGGDDARGPATRSRRSRGCSSAAGRLPRVRWPGVIPSHLTASADDTATRRFHCATTDDPSARRPGRRCARAGRSDEKARRTVATLTRREQPRSMRSPAGRSISSRDRCGRRRLRGAHGEVDGSLVAVSSTGNHRPVEDGMGSAAARAEPLARPAKGARRLDKPCHLQPSAMRSPNHSRPKAVPASRTTAARTETRGSGSWTTGPFVHRVLDRLHLFSWSARPARTRSGVAARAALPPPP